MTTPFNRLPSGGRIDRSKPLTFDLDGKPYLGFAGDTLASALLANDVMTLARSFKYHRPRGIMSAGIEEPNALLTLGSGGRREPNSPATMTELVSGIVAETQNRWPSIGLDLMAVNALFAPLLSAGFYYKTFMGPTKGAWMAYEPFIRRAAGLGRGTHQPDPDRYDVRHGFCDVLVVGAGPAGIAAALAAGRSGARVVLAEQDFLAGGALLAEPVGSEAAAWLDAHMAELSSMPEVRVLLRTTVFGLYDGNTAGLVERRDHLRPDPAKGSARQVVEVLRARAIVMATGAMERPLVFANNDRPGVMLASALKTYLHRFAVKPGTRAVIATNNDSAYRTAVDLALAGVGVTLADLRREVGPDVAARARSAGVDVITGTAVVDVAGRSRAVGAVLAEFDPARRKLGSVIETRSCDVIGMSGGWSPVVHLSSHGGIRPAWNEAIAAFVPGGLASGHFVAGALTGEPTTSAAIEQGAIAGARAAAYAGFSPGDGKVEPLTLASETQSGIRPIWEVPTVGRGKAFVDFQNDVTAKDVRLAYREGYQSVEHLKRYTTLGMGTDQGKTSNVNALAIMAGLRDLGIAETGTTTFRPPYAPVAIGALAGRSVRHHFRPRRLSPLHDWHAANGAEFIEAGPWLRAWWYRWAGSSAEEAYIKEMLAVRRNVGIADVSSLGKIDIQGPDAAKFLDLVYVNKFAKLPVGKARYGVMLGDDGIVFDDGTTTRLDETRYFMTTTTAMAGETMSWLEFLLQTQWRDLDVHVTSLTDEWAAMAVSGPKSREALALALPDADLSNEALPYMAAKEFTLDGVPVRIIRLSFSGELAYEVYVPADYGTALWQHILTRAAPLDIKPYGLEALASLRIEKGHVAGIELDHRNTLGDLGLAKLAATDKPFIGDVLSKRERHLGESRWSLVGLECLEPEKRLRGGAILFAAGDEIKGHGRGYITAVTWSTELNKLIALALFEGGLKHEGEEIVCAYPLKDEQVRARIVSPHFIDREGKRLHA